MKNRCIKSELKERFPRHYIDIVFGARQTGKTTLLRDLLDPVLSYNLADPRERNRLLMDPGIFMQECEALPDNQKHQVIFIDEVQLVPHLFDAVQALYDNDKERWKFILCGSSARKLRKAGTNLLPGRSILHRLYPLTLLERPSPNIFNQELRVLHDLAETENTFPAAGLNERLIYGDLPGIVLESNLKEKSLLLQSYSVIHLEEEIRKEALVKDWGAFINFLRLAAMESGKVINYTNLSREVGVSLPTVKNYYQLLEDIFIVFYIPAFSGSPRKNILSTPRVCFFDIGVRHAAAGLTLSEDLLTIDSGNIFEQWVGIELYKRMAYSHYGKLNYLRTKDGAEIDYIIKTENSLIPIEVKWTDKPSYKDARHLISFLKEQKNANKGYIICRCPRPAKIADNVLALPWYMI